MSTTPCPLTLLLQFSDDLTSTNGSSHAVPPIPMEGEAHWSDLSSDDWEQLVRAVGDDASSDESSQSADRTPHGQTREKHRTYQSQRYRQRKRLELEQLRMEAAVLQATLGELEAKRQQASSAVRAPRQATATQVWKRIALNQKASRLASEEENARLRAALECETRVAQKLENLVRKRSRTLAAQHQATHKRRCSDDDRLLERRIFQQLHQRILPRLLDVDALLHQVGFATRKIDLEQIDACDGSSADWQVLFSKVFPFRHELTGATIWDCCGSMLSRTGGQQLLRGNAWSDTEIEMVFEIPISLRHCDARIEAHVVMRRAKEPSRIVQWYEGAWVLRSANEIYDGITLRDHGWHVIHELDAGAEGDGGFAIVQCCSYLKLDTTRIADPEEAAAFRQLITQHYNRNQQNSFKLFETALIEQATVATLPIVY